MIHYLHEIVELSNHSEIIYVTCNLYLVQGECDDKIIILKIMMIQS